MSIDSISRGIQQPSKSSFHFLGVTSDTTTSYSIEIRVEAPPELEGNMDPVFPPQASDLFGLTSGESTPPCRTSCASDLQEIVIDIRPRTPVVPLPDDVMSLIFQNLGYKDLLLRCSVVSKQWNRVVSTDEGLWDFLEAKHRHRRPEETEDNATVSLSSKERFVLYEKALIDSIRAAKLEMQKKKRRLLEIHEASLRKQSVNTIGHKFISVFTANRYGCVLFCLLLIATLLTGLAGDSVISITAAVIVALTACIMTLVFFTFFIMSRAGRYRVPSPLYPGRMIVNPQVLFAFVAIAFALCFMTFLIPTVLVLDFGAPLNVWLCTIPLMTGFSICALWLASMFLHVASPAERIMLSAGIGVLICTNIFFVLMSMEINQTFTWEWSYVFVPLYVADALPFAAWILAMFLDCRRERLECCSVRNVQHYLLFFGVPSLLCALGAVAEGVLLEEIAGKISITSHAELIPAYIIFAIPAVIFGYRWRRG